MLIDLHCKRISPKNAVRLDSSSLQPAFDGFTLVEMLISVIILGTLLISGAYFITHLTYTSKIGGKQKSVEEWGRVDYLLETDIREAQLASIGGIPGQASCLSSPATPELGLLTADNKPIAYYNSTLGGKPIIRRCGPDVNADGTLSTTLSDNVAFFNAILTVESSDNLFIDYQIELPDLSVTERGYARLRSRVP